MFDRLSVLWETLRTGLWPVPLAMVLLALLLYLAAARVDAVMVDQSALRRWWLYSGSGDDARNLLTTLVTAIITMSSVVFSITVVALSLAANQFGSRLVRTYMSDIRTKLALGLFTMTVVYCLLALRAVEKDMPPAAVPHVLVTLGLLLGLTCVLALLFFLHRVARSIVADEVIRRVAGELEETIDGLPALEAAGREDAGACDWPEDFDGRAAVLRAAEDGYVQAIEYGELAALAAKRDMLVRLDLRAGAFVARDGWLAAVCPAEALTPETAAAIRKAILVGERRTPNQDLEFSLRHLVDIALRALSPGINDANTALVVIDRLRGALSRLMCKQLPVASGHDQAGVLRVLGRANSYAGILAAALHQIRQAGAGQPAVVIALIAALGRIGEHVRLAQQREALLRHVRLVAAAGLRDLPEASDRADVEKAAADAIRKLERAPCAGPAKG